MENIISKELEEKIKNAENLNEVVGLLAKEGIEVTKEQLEAEVARLENAELDENALDDVSGGLIIAPTIVARYVAAAVFIWCVNKYNQHKKNKNRR